MFKANVTDACAVFPVGLGIFFLVSPAGKTNQAEQKKEKNSFQA